MPPPTKPNAKTFAVPCAFQKETDKPNANSVHHGIVLQGTQKTPCGKSLLVSSRICASPPKPQTVTNVLTPLPAKKSENTRATVNTTPIRKPLHKDSVYGEVILPSIASVNLKKALLKADRILDKRLKDKIFELRKLYNYSNKQIEEHLTKVCINCPEWKNYDFKKIAVRILSNDADATHIVAIRKPLDESFDKVKINTITDTGIQKILLNHLSRYADDPKKAFSPEGIEDMNANIASLNGGKQHLPIYKVRVSEKDNGGYFPQ